MTSFCSSPIHSSSIYGALTLWQALGTLGSGPKVVPRAELSVLVFLFLHKAMGEMFIKREFDGHSSAQYSPSSSPMSVLETAPAAPPSPFLPPCLCMGWPLSQDVLASFPLSVTTCSSYQVQLLPFSASRSYPPTELSSHPEPGLQPKPCPAHALHQPPNCECPHVGKELAQGHPARVCL